MDYAVVEIKDRTGGRANVIHHEVERTLEPGVYQLIIDHLTGSNLFRSVKLSDEKLVDAGGLGVSIATEVVDFMACREAFQKAGLPHKRGYLLHGEPGCGKSCTLKLIEKEFIARTKGYVLLWNRSSGSVENYYTALRTAEPLAPILIVVEDIETMMANYEVSLLEFLDGHQKLDNTIMIATTNFIDLVPDRIKARPSRIDRVLEIKAPTREERERYLNTFGLDSKIAKSLVDITDGLSFAHMKEMFIATQLLGQTPTTALSGLRLPSKKSDKKNKSAEMDQLLDLNYEREEIKGN